MLRRKVVKISKCAKVSFSPNENFYKVDIDFIKINTLVLKVSLIVLKDNTKVLFKR